MHAEEPRKGSKVGGSIPPRSIRFIPLYFQPIPLAQETMISEMLRTSRWFYVQEPDWPPGPRRRNSWYRKRVLYAEIIRIVKDSPGISTGEVARQLGRPRLWAGSIAI